MLQVVQDAEVAGENTWERSLLDAIVRDGARAMLAAALQAEVAAYVEAFAEEVDETGRRMVVRNGHHVEREVTTAAGAVPVRAPRVNDKRTDPVTGQRKRFASAILPAWARKSPRVAEVLPLLYLQRAVHQRFRARVGAVPRLRGRALAGHDHPADPGLAGLVFNRPGGRPVPG